MLTLKNVHLTALFFLIGALSTSVPLWAQTTSQTTSSQKSRTTTTTTTEVSSRSAPRKVYDQKTLEKMADTGALCTKGFKAYVGNNEKNLCQGQATSPDMAYSCVWDEKGPVAFTQTPEGPCTLDFAVHHGEIIVSKENYKSSPPLSYGKVVECCLRAAKDTPERVHTHTRKQGPK